MLLDEEGKPTLPKVGDEVEIKLIGGSVAFVLIRENLHLKSPDGEDVLSFFMEPSETILRNFLQKIFSIFSLGIEPIETDSDTKFRYKIVPEDPQ